MLLSKVGCKGVIHCFFPVKVRQMKQFLKPRNPVVILKIADYKIKFSIKKRAL